jgi:predicted outer membrane protein
MKRIAAGAATVALSIPGLLGLAATGTAGATTTAASKPSAQDLKWLRSNAQTDLAEISLGTLVQKKSSNAGTLRLARITKSQHKTVLAKLRVLAQDLHVTVPASPSSAQLKQASQLKTLSDLTFDKTYDNDQITGHKLSIGQTKLETRKGTNSRVVRFAKHYLPIAEMHLKMAEKLKRALTH